MSGYVYLIGSSKFRWYKIGKSKTPDVRVKDIGILLPFKIQVFGVWKAENHSLMESAMHEIYAPHRINGEWFAFSDKKIREIRDSIPGEACVFWYKRDTNSKLSKFSNVDQDILLRKDKNEKMQVIQIVRKEDRHINTKLQIV